MARPGRVSHRHAPPSVAACHSPGRRPKKARSLTAARWPLPFVNWTGRGCKRRKAGVVADIVIPYRLPIARMRAVPSHRSCQIARDGVKRSPGEQDGSGPTRCEVFGARRPSRPRPGRTSDDCVGRCVLLTGGTTPGRAWRSHLQRSKRITVWRTECSASRGRCAEEARAGGRASRLRTARRRSSRRRAFVAPPFS